MKNKPLRHKESNTFKFIPFSQRISELEVDVLHRVGHKNEIVETDSEETFLYKALCKWNVLNLCLDYEKFRADLPNVETLPLLLLEKEKVIEVFLHHLELPNHFALEAILDCLCAFVRDLQHEIFPNIESVLNGLSKLLFIKDVDVLEWTLTCHAYIFKYLWRSIVKTPSTLFNLVIPLLCKNKPAYINNFAAESFAFVVRKVKAKEEILQTVVQVIEENPNGVMGCGVLLFEVLQGVGKEFHSCAEAFLPVLLKSLYNECTNRKLLYEILTHTISAMCAGINPSKFSLFWNTCFDVLDEYCSSSVEGRSFHLLLMKQVVEYKRGKQVQEPDYIGTECCALLSVVNDKNSVITIMEMCVSMLLLQEATLSVAISHQIVHQVLEIENKEIVFDFVGRVLQYPGFEILVLPWVRKYSALEIRRTAPGVSLNKSLLNLLTLIVNKKSTFRYCPTNLQCWRPYPLNFPDMECNAYFEEHFCIMCQNVSVLSDPLNDIEEFLYLLHIVPNVKLISRSNVLNAVQILMKCIANELKKDSHIYASSSDEIMNTQKLLLWYFSTLEAKIHILGSKREKGIAFISDTVFLLSYIGKPQFIFALYAVDMYMTAYIEQLSESDRKELFSVIYVNAVRNLSSPFSYIRCTTSHLLSLFKFSACPEEDYGLCLLIENIPIEYLNLRKHLSMISNLNLKRFESCGTSFKKGILYYLSGLLYLNFQLLWDPVTSTIVSYAKDTADVFWDVFDELLKMSACYGTGFYPELPNTDLFDSCVLNKIYNSSLIFEDRPDFTNHRILLWKALAKVPEECETRTRLLSKLFLEFVEKECTSMVNLTYLCDIKKRDKIQSCQTTSENSKMRKLEEKRQIFQTLLAHMAVFSNLRNPKSVYREPELRALYYTFLVHSNVNLQRLALKCILAYKEEHLVPHSAFLNGLLDDHQFKSMISSCSAIEVPSTIEEERKYNLMTVVVRILYGRMLCSTRKRSSGRSTTRSRRSMVLRFIAGCEEDVVLYFLKLNFDVYGPLLKDNPEEMVQAIKESLDLSKVILLKKLRSSLSMLDVVMDVLGKLLECRAQIYILQILLAIGAMISGILAKKEEVYVGFLSILRSLKSKCLAALKKFFEVYIDFPWNVSWTNAVFDAFIWPNLFALLSEGTQNVTPLLRLFVTWSNKPRYVELLVKHLIGHPDIHPLQFVMDLLENEKTKQLVKYTIMGIVESLLTPPDEENDIDYVEEEEPLAAPLVPLDQKRLQFISEKEPGVVNERTMLVLPYIPVIIGHLVEVLKAKKNKKRKLSCRDAFILSRICELVDDDLCEALLQLILPIMQKNTDSSEPISNLFVSMKYLLKNVPNPYEYLSSIAPFFGSVSSISLRKLLCNTLLEMLETEWKYEKKLIVASVNSILDINAWDEKWIDQPDFSRRIEGFKQFHLMIDTDSVIIDYGLIVMHSCFYILKAVQDIGLRESSSCLLYKLVPFLFVKLVEERSFSVIDTILQLVSIGIRDKVHSEVREKSIMVLGKLVHECASLHPVLQSMDGLCSRTDPEVDFFNNITHLQSHRITRALLRFCDVAATLKKSPSPRTLTQFIFPIVSLFLISEKYLKKNSIVDAAIKSICIICRLLPWHQYEIILKYYLLQLRTLPAFGKQLLRIVEAILDAFHFDLSQASEMTLHRKNSQQTTLAVERMEPVNAYIDNGINEGNEISEVIEHNSPKEIDKENESERKKEGPWGSEGTTITVIYEKNKTEVGNYGVKSKDDDYEDNLDKNVGNEGSGNDKDTTDVEDDYELENDDVEDKENNDVEDGDIDDFEDEVCNDNFQKDVVNYLEFMMETTEEEQCLNDVNECSANVGSTVPVPDNKPAIERWPKLPCSTATRVMRIVSRELLPQLLATVGQYTSTEKMHKGNLKRITLNQAEEDILRIPVAIAVVRLLQQLPPVLLNEHLSGMFMKLCTFLKSRLERVRRVTRGTLQKIMVSLGPKYLDTLLQEMTPLLTKGFQVHVLVHTVHAILDQMKGTFQHGDMDGCLANVIKVCELDLFGPAAEEKSVAKIVGKVAEARGNKTYHTLSIAAQYVTEKCLLDLLAPFIKVMQYTNAHTFMSKVTRCLESISSGLADNEFVDVEAMIMFAMMCTAEDLPQLRGGGNKKDRPEGDKTRSKAVQRLDSFLISQAPRSRYGTSTIHPASSTKAYSHVIIEFGLRLFHVILKKGKIPFDKFDVLVNSAVPFVTKHLSSKEVKVTTNALNCLTCILKFELPALVDQINEIVALIFKLIHKYASAGHVWGDHSNLVSAAFKAVTVVVRNTHYHSITSDQLKALLLCVEQDINDEHHQVSDFPLLKAILSRGYNSPELETVINKVAELSIISKNASVRINSRQIIMQYVLHYPLGSKVDDFVQFFLAQLSYEVESGRMSAIKTLEDLITMLPEDHLNKLSLTLLCSLAQSLVNDTSSTCRERVALCIRILITKSDHDPLFDSVLSLLKSEKMIDQRLSAQLIGLFVEVEKDLFERRLNVVLPVVERHLTPGKRTWNVGTFVRLPQNLEAAEGSKRVKLEEHCLFFMLLLIEKLCTNCSAFLTAEKWQQNVGNIGECVVFHLANDHEGIRLNCCLILGHIFFTHYKDFKALVEASCSSLAPIDATFLYLNTRSKLRSLVLDLCDLLSSGTTNSRLINQVAKNLNYLARVILEIPNNEHMDDGSEEVKLSISWMLKRMMKVIHLEIINTPSVFILREAVFTWLGGLIINCTPEKLEPLVPLFFPLIARELENTAYSNSDVISLGHEIIKMVKDKIGNNKTSVFLSEAQMHLNARRAIRKRERVQQTITNPELAAKRKLNLQQKKKKNRQKKNALLKCKSGSGRKRKSSESEESPPKKGKWKITSFADL